MLIKQEIITSLFQSFFLIITILSNCVLLLSLGNLYTLIFTFLGKIFNALLGYNFRNYLVLRIEDMLVPKLYL